MKFLLVAFTIVMVIVGAYSAPRMDDICNSCKPGDEVAPLCGLLADDTTLTYKNFMDLHCAQLCGSSVQILHEGPCEKDKDHPLYRKKE